MLLGPRVYEGKRGFHLITPLVRTDGSTLLVNRGFISNEFADQSVRTEDIDEVEFIGVLRTSHTRNNFTPDNRPEEGEWHWADVDAMSDYAGGENAGVQPVFVEEIFGQYENMFKAPDYNKTTCRRACRKCGYKAIERNTRRAECIC